MFVMSVSISSFKENFLTLKTNFLQKKFIFFLKIIPLTASFSFFTLATTTTFANNVQAKSINLATTEIIKIVGDDIEKRQALITVIQ
jgi:hypothetical protein